MLKFFILYNLINKPHINILIVICDIHQFHLHFSHGVLLRSLDILSLVRYGVPCMGSFHMLLGRTFLLGLRIKKPLKLKKTFYKLRFFSSPV